MQCRVPRHLPSSNSFRDLTMTIHLRGTSAACAVLLAILSFPLQTIAQEVNCGSPPPVANENLEAEIYGQAQLLSKYLGDVSLAGKIKRSRTEIFSKYPDAEQSRWNAFYQYQVCVILMNDRSIPYSTKLKELNEIQREFSKPLIRSKKVTTGKERGEFLEDVRKVLRPGLPESEIESAMRAISKLRAMISEDDSDDSLGQAVQILVSYIKSNIENRKTEVKNLIEFDPKRGRGISTEGYPFLNRNSR